MMHWHRQRGAPIDTHVLIHHGRTHPDWLDQCLASLEDAPTNVLLVDDASDNVGALRAQAMSYGRAPYLCFVDDDDWAIADAFQPCIDVLDRDRSLVGAYTDFHSATLAGQHRVTTRKAAWCPHAQLLNIVGEVLHLHVFRRSAAKPYFAGLQRWPTLEEGWLFAQMVRHGAWKKLDIVGYHKREQNAGAGSRITPGLIKRAVAESAQVLLAARCPIHDHGRPAPSKPKNRIQRWAAVDTGCRGCNKVRGVVGRLVDRK